MNDENSIFRISRDLYLDIASFQEANSECSICRHLKDLSWASVTSLRNSSDNGCIYCHILWQALSICGRDAVDGGDPYELYFHNDPTDFRTSIQFNTPSGCNKLEISSHEAPGITNLSIKPAQFVSGNTSSKSQLHHARKWLQNCLCNHSRCQGTRISAKELLPMLPKRVIDVTPLDKSGAVRLVEPVGMRSLYLCLSHCWGASSRSPTTKKSTIQSRLCHIEFSMLPRTFQDAIDFVRWLGHRYIWIDSLCIIQDDFDDWDYHAVQMADIYQNSYLTLAATKAPDSEAGLYNTRNNFTHTRIPAKSDTGEECTLYCRKKVPHWYHRSDWEIRPLEDLTVPLLRRAWVFQERLLSPRILHFGSAELSWECCEIFECECTFGLPSVSRSYPKIQHSISLSESSQESRASMWQNIVEAYTQLDITDPNDRLPALQGIASQLFRGDSPLKLLSGMWEGTLYQDLLWSTGPAGNSPIYRARRADPWRAPSWAWASIDASIYYHREVRNMTRYAAIDDVHTRDGDNRNRTIVTATTIQLSAPALPGKIVYKPAKFARTKWIIFDHPKRIACNPPFLDEYAADWDYSKPGVDHIKSGTNVLCLLLAETHSSYWNVEVVLIVRPIGNGERHFERVGCFKRHFISTLPPPIYSNTDRLREMFDGIEKTSFTIV